MISPYTQTGAVDSTIYSSVSVLRTIETIFGVPPLTQFDAAANSMSRAFSTIPNLRRLKKLSVDTDSGHGHLLEQVWCSDGAVGVAGRAGLEFG